MLSIVSVMIFAGTEILPVLTSGETGKALDPGQLFADAIANDMNPEFINEILNTVMEGNDQP